MSLFMFAAALLIGLAQTELLSKLRRQSARVKRWGGWILIGVGTWLVVLAVFAEWFTTFI